MTQEIQQQTDYAPWVSSSGSIQGLREFRVGDIVEVRINDECPYWNTASRGHFGCHTPDAQGKQARIISMTYWDINLPGHQLEVLFQPDEFPNDVLNDHYAPSELRLVKEMQVWPYSPITQTTPTAISP